MNNIKNNAPNCSKLLLTALLLSSTGLNAQEQEVQDMSDPLAVYTQGGAGYTDKGLNLKIGQAYDTGSDTTAAMYVLELKGFWGDTLGWSDDAKVDNSIDAFRFRSFEVDLTNGRGTQIDMTYNLDASHLAEESGDISYSFIQALPKFGAINLYALAGAGLSFGNNVLEDDGRIDSGYSVYGTFAVVGLYGKLTITDDIWLNYNPMYVMALSGSNLYKDHAFGMNNDKVLLHELSASYQVNPRLNIRYFANWHQYNSFSDGDQRIEFNYQF